MPSNRKLPDIAPCPDPRCNGVQEIQDAGLDASVQVVCSCGWTGPHRVNARAAILAWNRRSDEAAERRGAMACFRWLESRMPGVAFDLREVIERGEVLPKAQNPEPWIVSKPGVMGGKPCVRGTRITIETLQAEDREFTRDLILDLHSGLTAEGLEAALAYRLPKAQKRGRKR